MTKTTLKSDLTLTKFQSRLLDLTNDANFTLGAKLRNLDVIIDAMFVDSQGNELMVEAEKHFRTMAKGWLLNMETYLMMTHIMENATDADKIAFSKRLRNDCMKNAREYMRTIKKFLRQN